VKATTMNFRGKKCIVEAIVDCCLVYWKEHRVEETFRSRASGFKVDVLMQPFPSTPIYPNGKMNQVSICRNIF
jgi:hypothetical protein